MTPRERTGLLFPRCRHGHSDPHGAVGASPKSLTVSAAVFITGIGPWSSVAILAVSTLSAATILARYHRHTEVQRPALLAVPVAAAGAMLALLVVMVPYLIATPPIDDRALAATLATPQWLWPATTAIATWSGVLAYSIWTARLFHRQQRPTSPASRRTRTACHV